MSSLKNYKDVEIFKELNLTVRKYKFKDNK